MYGHQNIKGPDYVMEIQMSIILGSSLC
jgi:hypothetical protein